MKADLIIFNIKRIYTPYLIPPVRGKEMNKIKIFENPFIVIKDQKILSIGIGDYQELDRKSGV